MRHTAARIALGTLTAALAFGLSACNDTSSSSPAAATGTASTSTASLAPATSASAFPAAGHELAECGTGPWGLAIVASTAKGNEFCQTAAEVVNAYATERTKKADGDIAVTVADIRWVCGERQGDPNPYQECASQNESAEEIRLVS
ncbi:hypothetical protein [Nocardia jejuensis]|uniref:hypothetical protein n=1 Tax=Nocardia jejuensis TaxID=328049 RepID=UPI000836B351|nr:hypothetical protein [Nocardia jejuensis]